MGGRVGWRFARLPSSISASTVHSRAGGNPQALAYDARICRKVLDSRFRGNDGRRRAGMTAAVGMTGLRRVGAVGKWRVGPIIRYCRGKGNLGNRG